MTDAMRELADEIVDFEGEDGESAITDTSVFGNQYTVAATYQPGGDGILPKQARVEVDVLANTDEVATLTITRFGTTGQLLKSVPVDRRRLFGSRGKTGAKSAEYLAHLLRELVVEGHRNYVGARDDYPGVRVAWDTIFEAGKFARDYRRGEASLRDLASPSKNPFL